MVTPKAYRKILGAVASKKIMSISNVALIVAASNVLIVDVSKKGELILKHI